MTRIAERAGVRHLIALAQRPRPAGGDAERDAREYAANELRALGFDVREERFRYSSFPGRYAVPVSGAVLAISIATSALMVLAWGSIILAGALLATATVAVAAFARWVLGDAMFTLPWLAADGVNLIASRAADPPRVWLVAHLDSKSQPIPSAVRVVAISVLMLALVGAGVALALTLAGFDVRMVWWGVLAAAGIGGIPVSASVVGGKSAGAVDNASGVASVLVAASLLAHEVPVGVLLPTAEELGLVGARAFARDREAGTALNCDGVDDDGDLLIMFNSEAPRRVVDAVRAASLGAARARRMPLGLLTDSSALASRGWDAVTVSRGSFATLRRIHSEADALERLDGTSIDSVGSILARAAEALAQ